MDIGIGLPSTIPGVEATDVISWARRAEERGFSSVATIDRIVYGNYEPLATLAAAAAVTQRVRLLTAILIAPLRANATLLAKQTATIDCLSGGRLVLGLAVGGREDDYTASEIDFHHRGRQFERQLEKLRRVWSGESFGFAGAVGPRPARQPGPQLIVGGAADAAISRVARYADGWIAGGGGPGAFAQGAAAVRSVWTAAGRSGQPKLIALHYFSLGPSAQENASRYLHDYYGFAGPFADRIAEAAASSEQQVKEAAGAFRDAGCDELVFFPCSTDLEQVDLLARTVL